MDLATIRMLYRYNAWANERVLKAAATAPHDAFVRDLGHGSIRDILTHIVWSEWIWLQRWTGATDLVFQPADFAQAPPALVFAPVDFPDVDSLRDRSRPVADAISTFLRGLSPERLWELSEYRTVTDATWQCALWKQLYHGVNHSTYHRGQVAMMLRQLGCVPIATDFVSYEE